MKVTNMEGRTGKVANQFIVKGDNSEIVFQSYNSIIAKKAEGKVYLDSTYWNYSRTTAKYRNQFLEETTKETERKIKSGEYILADLNG
jgi:hypothetical protein